MHERSFRRRVQLAATTGIRSAWRSGSSAIAGPKRRKAERELIQSSSLFDSDWYLLTYPDVARAGTDPLAHYIDHGWREGRDPGPEFETSAYLRANPDVARSGVNPLLHYVEFGHAEGRNIFSHRPLLQGGSPASFEFSKPADCASFPLSAAPSIPWRRSYRLDKNNPGSVVIGDFVVGHAKEASQRAAVSDAFDLLALLSGSSAGSRAELPDIRSASQRLADAWFLNSAGLRTRWRAEKFPFVVRVYQHDPVSDVGASLVGESLVSSPIDMVDLHLNNAFFPVLFVFAEPDGELWGNQILAFPSLCRGGAHYAELISAFGGHERELDSLGHGHVLAERLIRLIRRESDPAIANVAVDLDGADGTGRLFQRDMQLWLERVVGVRVVPCAARKAGRAERFLTDAVKIEPENSRGDRGATLVLGHDMIPTIAALTEPRHELGTGARQILVPLLVAEVDPSQPTSSIELPMEEAGVLASLSPAGAAIWPYLECEAGLPRTFRAGAVRFAARSELTDAELVAPLGGMGAFRPASQRQQITWMVSLEDWEEGQLAHSIRSMALQDGGSADSLALIGPGQRQITAIAEAAFPGWVMTFGSWEVAARELKTPLAGFVGPGVLLHNNHSAGFYSALLENDAVASVTCPLISVERMGGVWHASISDVGGFDACLQHSTRPGELTDAMKHLWRTNFPVAAPLKDFWLARSSNVAKWIDKTPSLEPGTVHICTTLVTASRLGRTGASRSAIVVPAAPKDRVTNVEVLFG